MSSTLMDRLANGGNEPASLIVKKGIDVIPYNAQLDPNADKFLPWFWNRLKDDGLISLYFPGAEQTGFSTFVKLFSGNVLIHLVVMRDEEGQVVDTVGFTSLSLMPLLGIVTAEAGFIFLKDYWDRTTSTAAIQQVIDIWFADETLSLSVILGIIAEKNVLVRRFLTRLGWTHSGNIPNLHQYQGERSAASIWYLTREQHETQLKGGA